MPILCERAEKKLHSKVFMAVVDGCCELVTSATCSNIMLENGNIVYVLWTLYTVFPRIEAPGFYLYNYIRPPACIRGWACIQGRLVLVHPH